MEHADPQELKKYIRKALTVFAVLIILTFVTVLVAQVHLGHAGNIIVALVIAALKASLVGAYFMHLIDEKQLIFAVLIVSAIFFLAMLGLPMFQHLDGIVR
jgi:cytochrome c oxidase subunit 4